MQFNVPISSPLAYNYTFSDEMEKILYYPDTACSKYFLENNEYDKQPVT